MEIDYIALFVTDVAQSVAFYRDILGFQFAKPPTDSGCEGRSGALKIGIYNRSWLSTLFDERLDEQDTSCRDRQSISGNPFLLSMTVSDLDAVYQHLLAANVKAIATPREMRWGQRVVFLEDPDGNLLEIVQK